MNIADNQQNNRDEYSRLLSEVQKIRGISIWRDVWMRIRKNGAAMLSLAFLVVLGLVAFLAPVLPLQSPQYQDMVKRQLLAPNVSQISLYKTSVAEYQRELDLLYERSRKWSEYASISRLYDDVAKTRMIWIEARDEIDQRFSNQSVETSEILQSDNSVPNRVQRYSEKFKAKRIQLQEQVNRISDGKDILKLKETIESWEANHPIHALWSNSGTLTRWMLECRLRFVGDWCIPSVLGTDNLGRDVLSRVIWGARISLIVGIVATLVSLVIGVSYGAISGYCGGWVDALMMRIVDVIYSVPFIFVVIFMITIVKEEQLASWLKSHGIDQITVFFLMIGAIYWLTMARVVRGQVISLKQEPFVDAARVVGASRIRIVFQHLVPNVMGIVIVYLTLTIPQVMRFEAFLSFLGLGVEPPAVSWGLLVNEGIQVITPVRTYWWLVVYPGIALALTLFCLSFLGDGLRDAFDPRMKNK